MARKLRPGRWRRGWLMEGVGKKDNRCLIDYFWEVREQEDDRWEGKMK